MHHAAANQACCHEANMRPSIDCADAESAALSLQTQSQHLGLRVGGLFIILFVTSLGVLIPLVGKRFDSALFLARAFGAGAVTPELL